VLIRRSIGVPKLRNLDPFLMLDHFSSDDPNDYLAGFPDHPHRGFVTLTYMLDGHMLHRDSMGNSGDLRDGGAQWMKAASGVIHSEMPKQTDGLMRGFQLWINLPAAEKMSAPAYQAISPEAIPDVRNGGIRVKVLSGTYGGIPGPVSDPFTDLHYLDVDLDPGADFETPISAGYAAFLHPFKGEIQVADTSLSSGELAVLSDGDRISVQSRTGARFILVAGRPIGEPIVQHGPFVMNTREEIEQAFADFRAGRLVRERPELVEK